MKKKLVALFLALVMALSLAPMVAFAADGVHNKQPYPISWDTQPLGSGFDAKNWDAVPDPMSLRGTTKEYVLWHFQTGPAGSWRGPAYITFGENGTFTMSACGQDGSHYAVITPADWKITNLVWETDSVTSQLRLSHVEYNPSQNGSLEVTAEVMERYYKEYHKPVYKKGGSDDTLVSEVRTVAGNNQANQTWINGFTYVKINTEAAKSKNGVNVWIADSSKAYKSKAGNEGIGYSYNVKIDAAGNVVISFDGNLIYANIVARVLSASAAGKFENAGNHRSVVTGGSLNAFNGWAPKGNASETFYKVTNEKEIILFVHFSGLSFYEIDSQGNRIVIGCEIDNDPTLDRGPFTRPYAGDEDVYMVVTQSVYNAALDKYVDVEFYNGQLGSVIDLPAGDYIVTIYVGDIEVDSATVTVVAGSNTDFDFGELIIPNYTGAPEIICNCGLATCGCGC